MMRDDMQTEYALSSYWYDLPAEQIAQHPLERGASRLLVVDRASGTEEDRLFADLTSVLPKGALLVANNSRVIPARLVGQRPTGGAMELLLLTPLPLLEVTPCSEGCFQAEAEVLLKPGKHARVGAQFTFGETLRVEVLEKQDFGRHRVRLVWTGDLQTFFETHGHLPLPPYIRRDDTQDDLKTYQTVYAHDAKIGSVAAPTAGLHFTESMRHELATQGFLWAEVTLHVGYGTFSPVRCEDIREHVMHPEFVEVPEATVKAIKTAKAEGRPVFAIGTTSARTLEGVASLHGGELAPHLGWINCFMYPGYRFQVVDGLLTNFHLPESTLLMLVAALTGRERILAVYEGAVQRQYRFFSYGDAMLIR